jgi:hypothetical protein
MVGFAGEAALQGRGGEVAQTIITAPVHDHFVDGINQNEAIWPRNAAIGILLCPFRDVFIDGFKISRQHETVVENEFLQDANGPEDGAEGAIRAPDTY